jgi:hypothetical protein
MVLAVSEDEDALFEAITAGAAAFILKDDLVTIVTRVSIGEYLVDDQVFAKPAVASRVVKESRELAVYGQGAAPIFAPLTPREVGTRSPRMEAATPSPSAIGRAGDHRAPAQLHPLCAVMVRERALGTAGSRRHAG